MDSLENTLPEYVFFTKIDRIISWAKEHSLSMLPLDLACCGIEMMQTMGSRFDIERFGAAPKMSPRHADLLILAGTITYKMAAEIKKMYDEMPYPKYVIAMGSCANSGGPFSWEYSYSSVSGADKLLPIDVYVPGCPPRPEAVLHGLLLLKQKIKAGRVLVEDELGLQAPRS